MEYFSLGDLGHWINAPFPEAEAQEISRQILEGLEILHRDKITHRDLKPQNIFVVEKPPSSPKWWIKIGDFGISKRLGEETTSFGTEIGTANYMAPELLDGETCKFTNAVDMWAFGCVLYLLLAWRMPFPDLKNRKRFAGAGDVPTQPLLDRCLSSKVVDFVTNLLAVNPDHRPSAQNALESPWMTTEVHLNPEASLSDSPAMRGTLPPFARDKSFTPEPVGGSANQDGGGTAIQLPRRYEEATDGTRLLDHPPTFLSPNGLSQRSSEHGETLRAREVQFTGVSFPGNPNDVFGMSGGLAKRTKNLLGMGPNFSEMDLPLTEAGVRDSGIDNIATGNQVAENSKVDPWLTGKDLPVSDPEPSPKEKKANPLSKSKVATASSSKTAKNKEVPEPVVEEKKSKDSVPGSFPGWFYDDDEDDVDDELMNPDDFFTSLEKKSSSIPQVGMRKTLESSRGVDLAQRERVREAQSSSAPPKSVTSDEQWTKLRSPRDRKPRSSTAKKDVSQAERHFTRSVEQSPVRRQRREAAVTAHEPQSEVSAGAEGNQGRLFPPGEPLAVKPVYFKGLLSISMTSSKPLPTVIKEVSRVLKCLHIDYTESSCGFYCNAPRIAWHESTDFEIRIVKIPLLSLHGIQFKRTGGAEGRYWHLRSIILDSLKL
jgi:serine/threonine protein kinase